MIVDVPTREIVRVTGRDRVAFLHRLLTANIAGITVGQGGPALLLNLKGHIVSFMHVFVRGEDVRLVFPEGQAEPAVAALSKYAVMDDVLLAPDAGLVGCVLLGPRTVESLSSIGVSVPPDLAAGVPWSHGEIDATGAGFGRLWLVRARQLGSEGFWIWGGRSSIESVKLRLAAAGLEHLARPDAEALRIAAGEPAFGSEITPEYFPMEIGLDGAIDNTKGCYLGQEPIVRIRDRGHTNWRLCRLLVEGAALPAPGDALETDAKPKAGRVTSAARTRQGQGVALAMVHVSVPGGAQVRIHHGEDVLIAHHQP